MHPSRKPNFKLNLGELDVFARYRTTTTWTPQDFAIAKLRVKRYQGYLRNSMIAGYTPWYANAGHRNRSVALGHQSPPSPRMRKLLKGLPRLDTAAQPLETVEDYFSIGEGWQKMVEPPSRPALHITPTLSNADRVRLPSDVVGYFDWRTVMREEAQRAQMATERYIAITELNRIVMTRADGAHMNCFACKVFVTKSCFACKAREYREDEFRRSLEYERKILDNIILCMLTSEPELVRLVPMYDEWKYRTAAKAVEHARAVRRSREKWAMKEPDLRRLVMQPGW